MIWLPPELVAAQQRRPLAPRADPEFRLADGTLVRREEDWTSPQGQQGYVYRGTRNLAIIATTDTTDRWGDLLHVSTSYPDHDPPWKILKAVRDAFYPADIDVLMILPRAEDYVNLHSHCFHMWQCPEPWLMR